MDNKLIPIADYTLSKMTYKQTMSLDSFVGWCASQYSIAFQGKDYEIVHSIVSGGREGKEIIQFFIDNDYVDKVNQIPQYELNDIGRKVNEVGGHEKYLLYKAAEIKAKNLEDFPKKKWYYYEPLRIILSVIITALLSIPIGYMIGKNANDKPQANTPLSTPKDTPLNKAQPLPKILGKKDSV